MSRNSLTGNGIGSRKNVWLNNSESIHFREGWKIGTKTVQYILLIDDCDKSRGIEFWTSFFDQQQRKLLAVPTFVVAVLIL